MIKFQIRFKKFTYKPALDAPISPDLSDTTVILYSQVSLCSFMFGKVSGTEMSQIRDYSSQVW